MEATTAKVASQVSLACNDAMLRGERSEVVREALDTVRAMGPERLAEKSSMREGRFATVNPNPLVAADGMSRRRSVAAVSKRKENERATGRRTRSTMTTAPSGRKTML